MVPAPSRILCCAAILATAAGTGACGANSKEKDRVKAAVRSFNASLSERDPGKFCKALTTKQRQSVTKGPNGGQRAGQTCEQVMRFVFAFSGRALKSARNAEVADVQVQGDRAKATVAYAKKKASLGLAKEKGEWHISNFDLRKL